jgi:methionine biosynthesis protein MetW
VIHSPTQIYDAKYRGKAGEQQRIALWHKEALKVLDPLDRDQRILEVGCGNGRLLSRIEELGFDVLGIDVSSEAVQRCREKGLTAERVDISAGLPYVEQFDICVSIEVIEHIFDAYHFLAQLNKSLNVDGLVVLSTPNFGYYLWRWQYLKGRSPTQIQNPFHIRFFSADHLSKLVNTQGFDVLSMYSPVERFRWVAKALQKLKLRSQWEALTRGWGKTLFAILRKVDPPQYESLQQVRESGLR